MLDFVPYLVIAALPALAILRLRYVMRQRLTSKRYLELADSVLSRWRQIARGPYKGIPMNAAAWRSYGLGSDYEAIELARRMARDGLIELPGYGWMELFWGSPPAIATMTDNSWEGYGPRAETITFEGPIYGPVTAGSGSTQNIHGTVAYDIDQTLSELNALAFELYRIESGLPAEVAEGVRHAANVISESVERRDTGSLRLKATLRWLADLASGTGAGLLSAAITAAVAGLLASAA